MGQAAWSIPTLFTSLTFWWLPKGIHLPEWITIHEFGHNYWYGMVGSNEFEEAWLDEGINVYSEIKAMAKYYGEDRSMLNMGGLKISDFVLRRAHLMASGKMDPILKNSWEYYNHGSYRVNSYSKAALMLLTLENHLGEEVMSKIMRMYFERWKFKHPTSRDFIAVAEEVSGRDLSWFFNQLLYSPDKLDYAVGEIMSQRVEEPEGIFDKEEEKGEKQEKGSKKKEKVYKNEVTVVRKGELIFPQEVLIVFDNGEEIREKWDGKERWKRFIYFRPYQLRSAQVDPEHKVILDVNYTNNSRVLEAKKTSPLKYALSLMSRFQSILTLVSF